MPLSNFQQQVLDEEFQSVIDTFKGQDVDAVLIDKVQVALRKKLAEMVDYEPAYSGMTVMVSIDPDTEGRILVNLRLPGRVLFRMVPAQPAD